MMKERFVFSPSVKGLQPHELEIDPNSDDVDREGDAFLYKNIPFTGIWYCYYENGQIAEISHYLGGLSHGKWTEWYEDGSLKRQLNRVRSMSCLGEDITWYPYGIMKECRKVAYGATLAVTFWDERGRPTKYSYYDVEETWLNRCRRNRESHISRVQKGLMEPESLTPWTRILGLPEV